MANRPEKAKCAAHINRVPTNLVRAVTSNAPKVRAAINRAGPMAIIPQNLKRIRPMALPIHRPAAISRAKAISAVMATNLVRAVINNAPRAKAAIKDAPTNSVLRARAVTNVVTAAISHAKAVISNVLRVRAVTNVMMAATSSAPRGRAAISRAKARADIRNVRAAISSADANKIRECSPDVARALFPGQNALSTKCLFRIRTNRFVSTNS